MEQNELLEIIETTAEKTAGAVILTLKKEKFIKMVNISIHNIV